jgi:hypothetical protein
MAALMGFPLDWFAVLTGKCYRNGATVSRTDSESATMCEDSQPLQLPPPKPRSPSKESKRARKTPNISPTKNDGCNISPTKTQEDENLRAQPNISQQKKGRKKGSSNRKPASGSLSPTVQVKKGKTYPIVQGERVDKDLAYDYPDQFVWLYNWGIQDADGCWKNRSKRVPVSKVYSVRHAIKAHKPVEEVLQIIDSNS